MNKDKIHKYINLKGKLIDLSSPLVMGIMNLTPDSFYHGSRKQVESEIINRIVQIREEGANIIDVGGYSSRPNADFVTEKEEWSRLDSGLKILFKEYPDAIVSVDTFRSTIACKCVEKYGVSIINDISAGELDNNMFDTIADLKIPYIIMHMKGTPQTMMQYSTYENLMQELFIYFSRKIEVLHLKGIKDVIIDPGFGFSKTTSQNSQLMNRLDEFQIFDLPLLIGISRKAMIRNILECSIDESLNGTTILNTIALTKGADILRVHDVKEAVEIVKLFNEINKESSK